MPLAVVSQGSVPRVGADKESETGKATNKRLTLRTQLFNFPIDFGLIVDVDETGVGVHEGIPDKVRLKRGKIEPMISVAVWRGPTTA